MVTYLCAEAGKKVGVQIWRVEKFEIKDWEKKAYGSFYNGDAYIVLDTYHPLDDKGKPTDKLAFDLHFWLGKFSTQVPAMACLLLLPAVHTGLFVYLLRRTSAALLRTRRLNWTTI